MKLAWQQIPSPVISEILCNVGLDGVVIDTEHGFFNNETLFACIQVINLSKKLCYVRITEPNKSLARACLDSGVDGLIFSTVNRPIDCDRIHEMCKYPRHGGKRGLGLVRQNKWGAKELVSAPPKIIAQIETIEGVSNIDIISTYDFDYYMIGPYDLSASLGKPGNFDNIAYTKALKRVKAFVPNNKMAVHIPTDVKNQLKKYKNYGMMALGMDTTLLIQSYKEISGA